MSWGKKLKLKEFATSRLLDFDFLQGYQKNWRLWHIYIRVSVNLFIFAWSYISDDDPLELVEGG